MAGIGLLSGLARRARLYWVSNGTPWALPPKVTAEVAEIFADARPTSVAERLTHATEKLLEAREGMIPSQFYRAAARENRQRLLEEIRSFGSVDSYPELEYFRQFDPDYQNLQRLRLGDFGRVMRQGMHRLLQRASSIAEMRRTVREASTDVMTIRQVRNQGNGGATHPNTGRTFISLAIDWRNLLHRVPWSGLMMHEQEHVASMGGASGRLASWMIHSRNSFWNRLLNPLTPVTYRLATWADEGRAIGGTWELFSRIPTDVRAKLMREFAEELPMIPSPLLEAGKRRAILRRLEAAFAVRREQKQRLDGVIRYMELKYAGLSKQEFIDAMRPWCHYDLWGIMTFGMGMSWRFMAREGIIPQLVLAQVGYGLKVTAWAAGGYYLFADS